MRSELPHPTLPLLVWHSETGCSNVHAEAKSAEEMLYYHTHSGLVHVCEDSIPNVQYT